MQILLENSIQEDQCSELLVFLFRKEQLADKLFGHIAEVAEKAHTVFNQTIIEKINGILFFGGHELV